MIAAICATVPFDDPAPIPIAIFTPSRLFLDGDPARGFKGMTTGTPGMTTWAGLVRLLSRAPEGDPKSTRPERAEVGTRRVDRVRSQGRTPPRVGVQPRPDCSGSTSTRTATSRGAQGVLTLPEDRPQHVQVHRDLAEMPRHPPARRTPVATPTFSAALTAPSGRRSS